MTTPLTSQTKLKAVQQKIVEANPDGNWYPNTYGCDRCSYCSHKKPLRAIHLVDVLLALDSIRSNDSERYVSIDSKGTFTDWHGKNILEMGKGGWNLHKYSLTDQSDETISFLFDLLCQ